MPTTSMASARAPIANPQLTMPSARMMSLGVTSPTLWGDVNGIFLNPAVIGGTKYNQFMLASQSLLGYFDNKTALFSLPWNDFVIGGGFGSTMLNGIPETILDGDRIRSIGSYSSGFNILQATLSKTFDPVWGMNFLSVGTSAKIYQQAIKDKTRYAFGFDIGAIGTWAYTGLPFMNQISVGVSVINIFSTPLVWGDTGDTSTLPLQLFAGVRADMFDKKLSLFAQNALEGFSIGGEYAFPANFFLRASTDLKRISLGTGLQIDNLAGFNFQQYGFRLDYNYTMNPNSFDSDPTHTVSFTIMGNSQFEGPKITGPGSGTVAQSQAILEGTTQPQGRVMIYNNEVLVRTVYADNSGHWTAQVSLREGQNVFTARILGPDSETVFSSDRLVLTRPSY